MLYIEYKATDYLFFFLSSLLAVSSFSFFFFSVCMSICIDYLPVSNSFSQPEVRLPETLSLYLSIFLLFAYTSLPVSSLPSCLSNCNLFPILLSTCIWLSISLRYRLLMYLYPPVYFKSGFPASSPFLSSPHWQRLYSWDGRICPSLPRHILSFSDHSTLDSGSNTDFDFLVFHTKNLDTRVDF